MTTGKKLIRLLTYLGVIILQMLMTQVVTFIFSLLFPSMGDYFQGNPVLMATILGITFGVGAFWAGWLAIRLRWLPLAPKHLARFVGALLGAYLPLIATALIYRNFPDSSPVFWFSILGSLLGFYVMGWEEKRV